MSSGRKLLDRVERELDPKPPVVAGATCESSEPAFDDAPFWPVTRLASWSLTLLLAIGVTAPVIAGQRPGVKTLVLLLPALVATLSARALFEVLGFAVGRRGVIGNATPAVPPALLVVAIMFCASAIVGVRWSPLVAAVTAGMTMLNLTLAVAMRGVEVRVRLGLRRVYFVGSLAAQRDLKRELARRHHARLVGARTIPGSGLLESASLVQDALGSGATVLVLDGYAMRDPNLVEAASRLNLAGLRVRDLVSYYENEFKKVPLSELSPTWFLFDIASIHRRALYGVVRRASEFALSAALLILAAPLLLLAAVLIRLTTAGPALYRQQRVGRDGAEFTLIKLRTMVTSSGLQPSEAWATAHAHRVTSIGRFLRRFRIDELPQLWNVLRGDLALVGPRPEQVTIVERLDRELPHYNARHCIRPGITGWAQVNLGNGGSDEGTVAKLQRDLYYVKHQNLRLDALIVWLTVRAVLAGRG